LKLKIHCCPQCDAYYRAWFKAGLIAIACAILSLAASVFFGVAMLVFMGVGLIVFAVMADRFSRALPVFDHAREGYYYLTGANPAFLSRIPHLTADPLPHPQHMPAPSPTLSPNEMLIS
jgi:hypothetical protein